MRTIKTGIQPNGAMGTGSLVFNGNSLTSQVSNQNIVLDPNGTGYVHLSDTTTSSSTGTGALVVGGGVGIGGNLWVGGNIEGAGTINGGSF